MELVKALVKAGISVVLLVIGLSMLDYAPSVIIAILIVLFCGWVGLIFICGKEQTK